MSAMPFFSRGRLLPVLLACNIGVLSAQNAVVVTVEAADTTLTLGESTTVTVYGQIASTAESASDQIFSWNIDVLNDDGTVARGYVNVQTPTSDNDLLISDDGTQVGHHLREIYDTFLNNPGAGKGSRVVLVQFDLIARSMGTASFSVVPGTTAGLAHDFLVSRTGGGGFTGGDYTNASVSIRVLRPDLRLTVSRTGDLAEIVFNTISGFDHVVQVSDGQHPLSWTDLPGGPHNSGTASEDVAGEPRRLYRVCVVPPP